MANSKEMSDDKLRACKENFCIWILTGMRNSTKKFIRPVLGKENSDWFMSCIQYMIDSIKEVQDDRRRKRSL